nr:MAG TPA: hypothetical protein [Caudoviricetes sp.]
MSNTYTPQGICDAANKIKDYCHGTKCEQCLFYAQNEHTCYLTNYVFPSTWPHFSEQRWTTADITLAKALIMMGYTTATKTMQPDGDPAITVIKIDDDGSTPCVDKITRDSFQALKYGEAIRLEDITGRGAWQ